MTLRALCILSLSCVFALSACDDKKADGDKKADDKKADDKKADDKKADDKKADDTKAETPDVVEGSGDCSNNYQVVGAVNNEQLTESINGTTFTDESPFSCAVGASQTVSFQFNTSTTDPSSNCDYALTYVDSGGNSFSGTQQLSCSSTTLEFTTTATPNQGNQSCKGKGVLTEDPKIQLKDKNCGN